MMWSDGDILQSDFHIFRRLVDWVALREHPVSDAKCQSEWSREQCFTTLPYQGQAALSFYSRVSSFFGFYKVV